MGLKNNETNEEKIKECDKYIEMFEVCKKMYQIKKDRLKDEATILISKDGNN